MLSYRNKKFLSNEQKKEKEKYEDYGILIKCGSRFRIRKQ